jgi:hypothetical protein
MWWHHLIRHMARTYFPSSLHMHISEESIWYSTWLGYNSSSSLQTHICEDSIWSGTWLGHTLRAVFTCTYVRTPSDLAYGSDLTHRPLFKWTNVRTPSDPAHDSDILVLSEQSSHVQMRELNLIRHMTRTYSPSSLHMHICENSIWSGLWLGPNSPITLQMNRCEDSIWPGTLLGPNPPSSLEIYRCEDSTLSGTWLGPDSPSSFQIHRVTTHLSSRIFFYEKMSQATEKYVRSVTLLHIN